MVALAISCPVEADAQAFGTVTGTITQIGGGPLSGINVILPDLSLGTTTSESGRFVIRGVPAGSHTLEVSFLGYETRELSVSVSVGAETSVDVALASAPVRLGEIIVDAATRTPHRVFDAPAPISVVDPTTISDVAPMAQLPRALSSLPGVEVVQSDLFDFNVNTRGFNSSQTRRMLVLQDGRDLGIALLGIQEWSALTNVLDDARRIEVVRGPGSALYGANAYSGVIDIRTWRPSDVVGYKATIAGGGRNSLFANVRYSGVSSDGRLGYKISGGHQRGLNWSQSRTYTDGSSLQREYADATSEMVGSLTEAVPLFGQPIDPTTGAPTGDADPVSTSHASGRLDYMTGGGTLTVEGGGSLVKNTAFVTGIGRLQVGEVLRPWSRVAWESEGWTVFGWYAGRDTRDAPHQSLVSGASIVDKSSMYHLEARTSRTLTEGISLVLGGSVRDTRTDTEQTLFPLADDSRSDWYYSGYAQAQFEIGGNTQLVAAVRADDGTIFDAQLSPRIGLVYSPSTAHSFRLSAGRALQTPSQVEQFLEVGAGAPDLSAVETALRMSAIGPDLANVPVGALFTTSSAVPIVALGNSALEVETVKSFEAGYRGQVGDRVFVTVDGYYSQLDNFVTDLLPGANPTYGTWTAPTGANGVTPGSEAAVEAAVLSSLPAGIAAGLTRRLDGTTAVVLSYGNAGEAIEYGVELGASLAATRELTFDGNYTYFGFDVDEATTLPGDQLVPNAPRHRFNLTANYRGLQGVDGAASIRVLESFDWAAGAFAGKIPASQTVDLRLGYRLGSNARIHAVASNLFNQQRFHIYGGSVIGRRIMAGVTIAN